jgi:hypothetical protein
MINHLPTWDDIHHTGNPTKSAVINDLITTVKKKETRGQWEKSCADCSFETSEFVQVLMSLHNSPSSDFDREYRYLTMLKFMLHFIAHGNDAAHVFTFALRPSTEYPWLLMCQLHWSMNVCEH